MRAGRWLVGAAVAMLVAGCSGSGGDDDEGSADESTTTVVDVGALEAAFADGAPLATLRSVADDLTAVAGLGPTEATAVCDAAVPVLDAAGTPDELGTAAASVTDPDVAEAALDQQAAVSSLLAACRGEAPVSVEEAAAELAEANDALDAVLTDAGVG